MTGKFPWAGTVETVSCHMVWVQGQVLIVNTGEDTLVLAEFLPDLLPVVSRGQKQFRHVLKQMDKFNSTSGPLFVLKECRDNYTRVKLWAHGWQELEQFLLASLLLLTRWNLLF